MSLCLPVTDCIRLSYALIKAGWTILSEQFHLYLIQRHLWVDIHASKDGREILVEVKGFENIQSPMNDLANVLGQYILYRSALRLARIGLPLYLAVPIEAYNGVLNEAIGQQTLADEQIRVLVFDAVSEEVARWIH